MELIQSKLQECVRKGSMNSIGRLDNMLNGNSSSDYNDNGRNIDSDTKMNVDIDITTEGVISSQTLKQSGKDSSKIPHKASVTTKKKKLFLDMAQGQTGAKLARKKVTKMKKRGQIKNGQIIHKKTTKRIRKTKVV